MFEFLIGIEIAQSETCVESSTYNNESYTCKQVLFQSLLLKK